MNGSGGASGMPEAKRLKHTMSKANGGGFPKPHGGF
jgi:hypothetical protein